MTDRELLELAAKAAGYNDPIFVKTIGNIWNPLTDKGDAFSLAVKLKMEVYHGYDDGEAVYASYPDSDKRIAFAVEYYDSLNNNGCAVAATCRAITRAAAMTWDWTIALIEEKQK